MANKPETNFRENVVKPFLRGLKNTVDFPIQQRAIKGDPDIILCILGRFVALELKSDGGKLSKIQEFKKRRIERSLGIWIEACPKTWVHARNRLQLLDEGIT